MRKPNTGIYQCIDCKLIPANQDLAHKYANPKLRAFDRCNRCGSKHIYIAEEQI